MATQCKQEYTKEFRTVEQQTDKLLEHFPDTNRNEITNILNRINYYKLGLYIYPFRISQDSGALVRGIKFNDVILLYSFDKELRLLLLDAIETIETAMRMKLAYYIGEQNKFLFYIKQGK